MNYGYVSSDRMTIPLDPADEPNRNWIQLYHHVASSVNLRNRLVLEVGSGRGGGASFVKRYLEPEHMIGVDFSGKAVTLCRSVHRVEGLEFRVGDAESLPVDSSSVDIVINIESSHCYPDFEKFLSEVHRVLRPGGHFLYADFRNRDSLNRWRDSLNHCGMHLIRETEITGNVIAALERDDEVKRAFINRAVPRFLRPALSEFAGMRGTEMFESFRNGNLTYSSFVLKKQGDS